MKVRFIKYAAALWAGCFLLLFSFQPGNAQDLALFRLFRLNALLQLKYLNENRIEPFKSNHPYYKETLTLRNKGYFVSPKILEFEWGVVLGLTQDRYYSQTFNRKTNGKFLNGFFTGTFFKKNAYPLTIIWNQTNQNFEFNSGGYTSYNTGKFQLSWIVSRFYILGVMWADRRTTNENWYQLDRHVQRKQTRYAFSYSGQKKTQRSDFNLSYKARKLTDHIHRDRGYLMNDALVQYKYFLNEEKTSQWNSDITFYDRENEIRYRMLKIQQILRFKHSLGLQSNYLYKFSTINTQDYHSYLHTAYSSLQHQLYQSLSSYVGVSGTYNRMNNGKETAYSITRGINYNKKIPFNGKLQLSYKIADGKTDRNIRDVIYKIVGEHHLIINETPVFLNEFNIIVESIRVYNKEGDIIYEPGELRDYIIEVIGNQVQIIRTPFSRIKQEQVILVDYEFRTAPSMKYTTNTRGFSGGLYFKWFSIYYRLNKHLQNLISGDQITADFLQNLYFRDIGVKSSVYSERAGFTLLVEQKEFESQKLAYRQWTFSNGYFVRPGQNIVVIAKLNYHRMRYERLKRTMTIYAVRSELNWYPTTLFSIQVFGNYRHQEDPITKNQLNTEYGGHALWQWGIMRLKIYYARQYWKYAERNIRINRFYIEFERYF